MSDRAEFIDGPVNIVRLEGKVNNIKKVLYFFMDKHNPIGQETKCNKLTDNINDYIRIQDISEYLKSLMYELKKNNKTYDLFFEISDKHAKLTNDKDFSNTYTKGRYIDNMNDIFQYMYNIKISNNKENVIVSKTYSNFRFHYFDFRQHLKLFDLYDALFFLSDFIKQYYILEKNIGLIVDELILVKNIIYNNNKNNKQLQKFINKIKLKYHSENHLNNINEELNKIKPILETTINLFSEILNNKKELIKSPKKLIDTFNEAGYYLENYFANLVDLYTLRRILDKEYIETVFHYAGNFHGTYIIYFLITKYNFKATHVSLLRPKKTLKDINNPKSHDELRNNLIHPNPVQCSDIKHFPKKLQ